MGNSLRLSLLSDDAATSCRLLCSCAFFSLLLFEYQVVSLSLFNCGALLLHCCVWAGLVVAFNPRFQKILRAYILSDPPVYAMVRRKLQALNYHSADTFSVDDPHQVRMLVLWLEDQIIRHYKIEDRKSLRNVECPEWPQAFQKYCRDIECPISPDDILECLEWIAGFAVRLEYFDDSDKYSKQLSQDLINNKTEAPTVTSVNPLDNLDFQSEEFRNGVNSLATLLKITPHPNHLVTLEAICTLIINSTNEKDVKKEGTPFPIMETDLGFDLGDYVLNQAAKVLRLLYIHDLRDLQTKINECIVAVQSITADPKTDTKLGQVGVEVRKHR